MRHSTAGLGAVKTATNNNNNKPRKNCSPHQPRVSCVGWLAAQRTFAPFRRPQKNPPVRPYFKSNFSPLPKFQQASAWKHPLPPGTGTEPGVLSGLGAAQAAETRQFTQGQMPGQPGPVTCHEKLKPTRTRHRNHVNQQTTETKTLKSRICSNVAHGLGT